MAAVLEVCKILFFTKQGHTAQVQDHSWSYKRYHMLSTVYMHLHFLILKYNLTISEKKNASRLHFSYLQNSGTSIYMDNWESYKIL